MHIQITSDTSIASLGYHHPIKFKQKLMYYFLPYNILSERYKQIDVLMYYFTFIPEWLYNDKI